ncbi:hypothetical protein [Pseudomonas mucidolens]|uniref:Uncharacterized protein n=1 Tax=Pseudomonas mucidolens TaxID=46679 RepID=A0A1H2N3Y2_9PSED|nr:hypothetical protein [Pseudomonas mucidolens]SDV00170.1 hypothetical protein SAMN05216202_2946 [Pseudomonas mucidolens]SQH32677.1 Uncharacterised protein [Pseudomonas mucidolens]
MIYFAADIKSKHSIANVLLQDNISSYINDLYENHKIEIKTYNLPDGETRTAYVVDRTLTISTLPDGTIFSIGCNAHYKGLYKNMLSTGMPFSQIKKLTERQRIFNGALILNEDFGLCYVLPAPYDEIADNIENIPPMITLDEIYISDFSSWINTPQ